MRAARAEIGRARRGARRRSASRVQAALEERGAAAQCVVVEAERHEAPRDRERHGREIELHVGRQERLAPVVALAREPRPFVLGQVVEDLRGLVLDERRLLLDEQQLFVTGRELAQALRLKRPDHPDLVDANAEFERAGLVDVQRGKRLPYVDVRLAAGDDAEAAARAVDDDAVDRVRPCPGLCGRNAVAHHEPLVGLADDHRARVHVQSAGRQGHLRPDEREAPRIEVHGGGALDRLVDALEADPEAGEPRQRPAGEAVFQQFLHRAREQHRDVVGGERLFALVRDGGRLARMIVTHRDQHAAVWRGALAVAVLEGVPAAVHARTLAIPDRIDSVVLRAGQQHGLLRAPDGSGRKVFVDARLEHHVRVLEPRLVFPKLQVEAAER